MYLALRRGRRTFTQGYTCPVLLRNNPKSRFRFGYEAVTRYGATFQTAFPTKAICDFFWPEAKVDCPYPQLTLTERGREISFKGNSTILKISFGFGLLSVRSPLLGELQYCLFSFSY